MNLMNMEVDVVSSIFSLELLRTCFKDRIGGSFGGVLPKVRAISNAMFCTSFIFTYNQDKIELLQAFSFSLQRFQYG